MKQRKPRVVVDTNVIISAVVFGGNPAQIITMGGTKAVELYLSQHILQEVAGVLRKKFSWSPKQTRRTIEVLQRAASVVKPTERIFIARDEDDNAVLECAMAAQADYLISGDEDLLVLKENAGTKIVSPTQFIAFIQRKK